MTFRLLSRIAPAVAFLLISCANKEVEPAGNDAALTTISAYLDNGSDTRTAYELDKAAGKAVFNWLAGDQIDVVASIGDNSFTGIRFAALEGGPRSDFRDGVSQEDVTFEAIKAIYPAASLHEWAFYPSRGDTQAKEQGYAIDWEIDGADAITVTVPSKVRYQAANPLSIVPLFGLRDGASGYAFKPMTAVLGIPIKGIRGDMDFISIESDDAALTGAFALALSTGGGIISQDGALSGAGHKLTLEFSGLEGDYTFFFPVPEGTVPAGLKLSCGKSSNPDECMSITTRAAIDFTAGRIAICPEMAFTAIDQQWEDYCEGSFIDDFIWGQHSKYTAGVTIPVTIQRSGLHPEKYRIANPYTVANATFGYTPYAEGISADEWLTFTVSEDGSVFFYQFKLGIEDKDSGGRPMMITFPSVWSSSRTGVHNTVVSTLKNGAPVEVQLACVYSDPDDSGHMYSRDGEGSGSTNRIHIVFSYDMSAETWTFLGTGSYLDAFIWGRSNNFTAGEYVPVKVFESDFVENRYKVANPYLAAAERFGYTRPSFCSDGEEALMFTVSGSLVSFGSFDTGVNLDSGKQLMITHPTEWQSHGGSAGNAANNCVTSAQASGYPATVQLEPIYHQLNNYIQAPTGGGGYYYPPSGTSRRCYLNFPSISSDETWTSMGTGRYSDEFLWKANSLPPYWVEVEIFRSDSNPNRYRIANPYLLANAAFLRDAAGDGDEYMYLEVDPSTSLVTFGSLVTGMGKDDASGDSGKNFAIADAATWESVKTSGAAISAESSKVSAGSAAAPEEIQLYSAYYDADNVGYFYTNNTGLKRLRFPSWFEGETWTFYCDGSFRDPIHDTKFNSAYTLGTVPVSIQKSDKDSKRFRIANPYLQNSAIATIAKGTADEWMYFNYDNGLVYFETVRTGVQMGSADRILWVAHPVAGNVNDWYAKSSDFHGSYVVDAKTDGSPKAVRLGAYWLDALTPTTAHCYTRGGSSWDSGDEECRITITFDVRDYAIVSHIQYPMLSGTDNEILSITVPAGDLESLKLKVTGIEPANLKGFYTMQSGTYMGSIDYAPDADGNVNITPQSPAFTGNLAVYLKYAAGYTPVIGSSIGIEVKEITVSGTSYPIRQDASERHHPGIIVNTGGDVASVRGDGPETISAFRIPALVTTKDGTLIAAYDVRYQHSGDLQADIDVGMKRSTDGGKTWSDLQIIMDMGEYGGLSEAQNGIGDPCLLVDETTGDIMCFAVWTHGHEGGRALSWAGTGFDIADTPQFMMVRSSDDGLTWSAPVNITSSVKQYDWMMTFQGPGRGITMADGTLVVPMQHQEGTRALNSGIMYSKDHGLTWHTHNIARATTSESAVAEIEPGVLMLTMRDETNSRRRAVYTTTDLGRSWTPHSTDGQVVEPTCEASLLHVNAADNCLGADLLLFSNPNAPDGRYNMTIQASLDKGNSWSHMLIIDQGGSWGYSCLTMLDANTVGILYESSRANILFQAIPLTDIIR